jgi:hypothetical protein
MKQITNKTILKQGDKTFHPLEIDSVIYWIDKSTLADEMVAQSKPIHGVPVVSLDSYVNELTKLDLIHLIKIVQKSEDYKSVMGINLENTLKRLLSNYKSNQNHYNQKDIDRVVTLAREYTLTEKFGDTTVDFDLLEQQIFNQINSISVIEVDEQFNVISYE